MKRKLSDAFLSVLFCVLFTALLAVASILIRHIPAHLERYAYGIAGTIIAFVLTCIFLRLQKRSFQSIGLDLRRGTVLRFSGGFALGAALTTVIFLALYITTPIYLKPIPNAAIGAFLIPALALLPLSLMEEICFRGYPFALLKESWGVWGCQITISVLFALYHVVGGQSLLVSFLGPGVWAFVFGAGALYSKGIAFPTGIHFAAHFLLAAMGQKERIPSIWTIETASALPPRHKLKSIRREMCCRLYYWFARL